VPDRAPGGQRLKAIVVRADDVSAESLIRYMRERLSAQKVPTLVEFRAGLPRSEAGKLLRGVLE
jgi:long-chain acyl-CoA synthetase